METTLSGNMGQARLDLFAPPGGSMVSLLRSLGCFGFLGFIGFFLFSGTAPAQSTPLPPSSPQTSTPGGSRVAQPVNKELRPAARANTARPQAAPTVAQAQ